MADVGTLERVREHLAAEPSLREIRMFGGVSFMVDGKLVVNVRGDGRLLLRVDPAASAGLVSDHGAHRAEMGPGRDMGPGWLEVSPDLVVDDERLGWWIDVAAVHTASLPRPRRRSPQHGPAGPGG